MMFDELCKNKILKREKTVTRRLINLANPRRPAVPGHIHKIKIDRTKKVYGEIFILSCTQEQIKDINECEAKKEGFNSVDEYLDYFMEINDIDILYNEDWVWRVEFLLYSTFIDPNLDRNGQLR